MLNKIGCSTEYFSVVLRQSMLFGSHLDLLFTSLENTVFQHTYLSFFLIIQKLKRGPGCHEKLINANLNYNTHLVEDERENCCSLVARCLHSWSTLTNDINFWMQ